MILNFKIITKKKDQLISKKLNKTQKNKNID